MPNRPISHYSSRCRLVIYGLILQLLVLQPLVLAQEGAERKESTADENADTRIEAKTLAEATTKVNEAVEQGKVAGIAHLVFHSGKQAHYVQAGVRDIVSKEPMQRDSILRFYSMTKPITSVTAMTLFEQGKFQLDDPIAKFIPAFEKTTVFEKDADGKWQSVPAKKLMTIRDVFRHSTGYGYGGNGIEQLEDLYVQSGVKYRSPAGMMVPLMSIEKAANQLATIPAHHHPGERFTYGFSTDLLGRLIEVWSGKALDVAMKEAVLDPLGMQDTAFFVPEDKRDRFASCHTVSSGQLGIIDKNTTSPFADGFEFLSGGGGLLSTIEDYSHFCQMMVHQGSYQGKQVIKPETVELMFTDQLGGVAGGFKFGLGFAIDEIELGSGDTSRKAMQYRWGGYASTDFVLVPSEKMFQIVVRQQVPSQHGLASELIQHVYSGVK
ncbi:MAG: serine hydrolase domain-containing protein [Planctomycetota bacterium]